MGIVRSKKLGLYFMSYVALTFELSGRSEAEVTLERIVSGLIQVCIHFTVTLVVQLRSFEQP